MSPRNRPADTAAAKGRQHKGERSGWPHYRSKHRAASDRQASKAMRDLPLPVMLDDPRVPQNSPELVTDQSALDALVDALRAAGGFAYDTEFIGEQYYYPQYCVIQVATPERVTLIDGMADVDLGGFWSLLAEPEVLKLVHAGDQDLAPAVGLVGARPANIYDTQIVAGFAGLEYPLGLTRLTGELCDADLGGDFKFSAWDRRPLTETQLVYAANDVRYLWLLKDELDRRLKQTGYADWAHEENRLRCDPDRFISDPLGVRIKAKKQGSLKRRQLRVLHPLMLWRDGMARDNDVPVRAIIDDATMLLLIDDPPTTAEAVRRAKGLARPLKENHADELAALFTDALAGPLPPKRRPLKPLSGPAQSGLESAWAGFLDACEAASLSPALVANKKEITALVRAHFMREPFPDDSRLLHGWRRAFLDPVLGDLLNPDTEPTTAPRE